MAFDTSPLGKLMAEKGYIRGPFGSALKRGELKEIGIPVYEQQHAIEGVRTFRYFIDDQKYSELRRFTVETNDLIISCSGTVGRISVIQAGDPKGIISQALLILRPDVNKVLPYYLYYFLTSGTGAQELVNASQGAVQLNIAPRNIVESIPVPLPASIEIQCEIVRQLKVVDDKIALNRQINQTLEAMAQALFQSWFVDFDPVKAKVAARQSGRDPLRAAMTVISGKADADLDDLPTEEYERLATTAALFPDEMQDSELGEIPGGWGCVALGDVCNFSAGSAFSPEHQGSVEGDHPFIKVSDMNLPGNEVFVQSANNFVSNAQLSQMKAKLHPIGATVFAKIGVALTSNRRRLLTTQTIIDNNLMSATPIEGKLGPYHLYLALNNIDFNTLVSGTALPYLNVSDLRKIPLLLPSFEFSTGFEVVVSSMFSKMQTLAAQSLNLATVRDTLLPELLAGRPTSSVNDEA